MPKEIQFFSDTESDSEEPYRNIVLLELTENNNFTAVQDWLKNPRCNVNERDAHGNYAVTIAACNNNFRILELLFASGAKLDVTDESGLSPYDYAVENENTAMQEYIREHIAEPTLRS
jgi:ankyrin repeat protein